MQTIQGYEIEFDDGPPTTKLCGGPMSFSNEEKAAINMEVDSLLDKGAISQCNRSPGDFISQIFARPKKNSRRLRVILNLKYLNDFVQYQHFKMENLDCVINLVLKNDFFVSIDLSDAYFSIPVREEDRKYLKFYWGDKLFQYNVLCFGLSSAPRVFTKCLKPVMHLLRKKGHRVSVYIDDLILMHQDEKVLASQAKFTVDLLHSLGFCTNFEKSHLTPTKEIEHLGFKLNSKTLTVCLPEDKVKNVKELTWDLLFDQKPTIRKVAKLLGCFNAYTAGTKWGKLYIRRLERNKINALVNAKGNYASHIVLSSAAKEDMRWWLGEEIYIPKQMFSNKPALSIWSDASNLGWGAHTTSLSTGGRWTSQEATNHINWLELKACFFGLECFAKALSNVSVHVQLDSTVALSYIINQGGVIDTLDVLAKKLWVWCKGRNIWLTASHIKGVDNVIADQRSRVFHDNTEWALNDHAFDIICSKFGKPDIDLFASRLNNKLTPYCSWEPDPNSIQADSFSIDWGRFDICYAFPPFNMVGHVIQKMARDNVATLLLVCPNWPGQYWYPLLEQFGCLSEKSSIQFCNSRNLLSLPYDTLKTHELWHKLNLCCFRLSSRR